MSNRSFERVLSLACAVTLVFAVFPRPEHARAQDAAGLVAMTPADVIATPSADDGTQVTFVGEAIGEDLRSGDGGRWVNVLGGGAAVGVWMTTEDAAQITTWGDYHHVGDMIKVTGTVSIGCEDHAGEFDVHARNVTVVQGGYPRTGRIEPWKGVVGVIGMAIGVVEILIYRRSREVA